MNTDSEQYNAYTTSGLDCVRFNIVRKQSDLDAVEFDFPPDMCHQVFGSTEVVWGYKNPKIRISYAASSMHCFIDIKFDSIVPSEASQGLKPNVIKALRKWLPEGYTTSRETFLQVLAYEEVLAKKTFGKSVGETQREIDGKMRNFVVTQCDLNDPGFKDFHARLETWIVWFIDAASPIDMEDPRWFIYYLYEKCEDAEKGTLYYPVGYCTIYQYYAFPEHVRPRVSQFIVLPPFQNIGLGTFLLKSVYESLWQMPHVKDITVEDPSENFQKVRDYLDATFLQKELPAFSDKSIENGFTSAMSEEAKNKFKINAKQARRIYEILKYKKVKKSGQGLNEYKAELVFKAEYSYRKHEKKLKRLQGIKAFEKLYKVVVDTKKVRKEQTEKEVSNLIESYEPVVARLLKEGN